MSEFATNLFVPGHVAQELHEERLGRNEASRVAEISERLGAVDSRLECVLATRDLPEWEIRRGFYYVIRHNDDGQPSTWEVRNPDGSFREPDENVVEAFRAMDTHNPVVIRARRERDERRRRELERSKDRRDEDRVDEAVEHLTFLTRTQRAFPTVAPWKGAA